jgi:hypothetical protein
MKTQSENLRESDWVYSMVSENDETSKIYAKKNSEKAGAENRKKDDQKE